MKIMFPIGLEMKKNIPEKGINFQGPWQKGMTDKNGNKIPISHPNARCTIASNALSCFSDEAENPDGVKTRIFTYSGRDSGTMPPVWVAKNSDYGVVIGACIVSSATATEVGASGVKRAPWLMHHLSLELLGITWMLSLNFLGIN